MPTTNKHIALICNPTAHNKKALQLADSIVLVLQQKGIAYSIFTQYWPQQWDDFTEAWIVGGDGTVNYFINQYPTLSLPLALFAGGTANDLHFMLYGTVAFEKQIENVLAATPQKVDGGKCNGRLFLNGLGIGFDGAIVHNLLGKSKRPGKASYLLSILKHIFQYQEIGTTLTFPQSQQSTETFMVAVANGKRYGGGFSVTPNASVKDGLLDVMVVEKIKAAARLRYLPFIERGDHLHLPFVQYRTTSQIVIETAIPAHAHMDGEYLMGNRFKVECLPGYFSFLL